MALETTIKNPHNKDEDIDAYFRVRAMNIDYVKQRGEIVVEVWKNKAVSQDGASKPIGSFITIPIASGMSLMGNGEIKQAGFGQIIDQQGEPNRKFIYKLLKTGRVRGHDLSKSKDV